MADGGNVEFVEIDGPIVRLRLKGACGSCPSSTTTMTMGIERRLRERIPELLEIEQVRRARASAVTDRGGDGGRWSAACSWLQRRFTWPRVHWEHGSKHAHARTCSA